MSEQDQQVFIGLDGPGGQLYQVSDREYFSYWQRIGYKKYGTAKLLPGFEIKHRQPAAIREIKLRLL